MTISEQTLAVAVLPTRRLSLEMEACNDTLSADRRQIEARIHEIFTDNPARALLAIGCIPREFRFSPSVEYWRSICADFVHDLRVNPRTEELREKQILPFPQEKAGEWLERSCIRLVQCV